MRTLLRLPLAAAALLVGAAVGVGAVAVHGWWWGVALGWLATLAGLLAWPRRWWLRLPYAAGWLVVLWLAMTQRDEGDYLIASTAKGYAVMLLGLAVLLGAVATSPGTRRASGASVT